jgi:hypothetical protein
MRYAVADKQCEAKLNLDAHRNDSMKHVGEVLVHGRVVDAKAIAITVSF